MPIRWSTEHLQDTRAKFGVTMRPVRERPAPRPDRGCQLAFGREKLWDVAGWLAIIS